MLDTGSVLKDRYLIEKHLGKGGMGSVYLAVDQTFGSKVAIKETIVHGGGLEEAFEREATVLNRLRHGAIPVVMDYFIEGEGRFLVMQYIPGDDLSTVMERSRKPVDPDKVLEWADKLLDALTYLHTQDPPIIHRDIKPQNVLFRYDGTPVLSDFGIAKLVDSDDTQLTVPGFTVGSPVYMSPEQIMGKKLDSRADLFATLAVPKDEELVARHVPEEQRLPVVDGVAPLGQKDQRSVPPLRIESAIEDLRDVSKPRCAARSDEIRGSQKIEILTLRPNEVPCGEDRVGLLDHRSLDDREGRGHACTRAYRHASARRA